MFFLFDEDCILNEMDELECDYDLDFYLEDLEDNDDIPNSRKSIFLHSFESYKDRFEPYCNDFNEDEEEESVKDFLSLNNKQFMFAKVNKSITKEELQEMLKMLEDINDDIDTYHFYFDKNLFCIRVIIRQENKNEEYDFFNEGDVTFINSPFISKISSSPSIVRNGIKKFNLFGSITTSNSFNPNPNNLFGLGKKKNSGIASYSLDQIYSANLINFIEGAYKYYKEKGYELCKLNFLCDYADSETNFLSSVGYTLAKTLGFNDFSNLGVRLLGYKDIGLIFLVEANTNNYYAVTTVGFNRSKGLFYYWIKAEYLSSNSY